MIIFTDQYISFIWPLIATTSNNMELLTVGVANLHSRGGVNFGLWSASAVMSLVPIADRVLRAAAAIHVSFPDGRPEAVSQRVEEL